MICRWLRAPLYVADVQSDQHKTGQRYTSVHMKSKTLNFKNCLGVFQGGGCKALAFVGAYKEADARGVFFSRLAGTSAGSIVAALIAAGASPDELQQLIANLDFNSFKKAPIKEPRPLSVNLFSHLLSFSPYEKHKSLAAFLRNLGIFSSATIEEWLEQSLRDLLSYKESAPVRFCDLNIPLHVVATDLKSGRPMVWNLETTPLASVAYAVRCSCTIPGYFQAVNSSYVDGGLVSNLPAFVLNNRISESFENLLCFTFAPDAAEYSARGADKPEVEAYLKRIAAAAIDGATEIQGSLQENLHLIQIGNLPLGTLDFNKISPQTIHEMFSVGEEAARKFFDAEVANMRPPVGRGAVFKTEAETLNQIVREDLSRGDSVLIAIKSTRYLYNLFPTFLHWLMAGVQVRFLCHPVPTSGWDAEHEPFQRFVLKELGADVKEVSSLPFECIIFGKLSTLESMIVFDERRKDENPPCFAAKYEAPIDVAAISAMRDVLLSLIEGEVNSGARPTLSVVRGGLEGLIQRLKTIPQYSHSRVSFALENVDAEQIVFLTKYVKSYKYNQIRRLFSLFDEHQFSSFECLQLLCNNGARDIFLPITPPVAEEHGGKLYLLEGNNRLIHLLRERRESRVSLIVVRGVTAPLPSHDRISIKQMLVTDEERTGSRRYGGFSRAQFREIELAAHRPSLYAGNYDD